MPINHLAPPSGLISDNVVGFARALRAAGIPLGPGAVIDALNALQMIEIGKRSEGTARTCANGRRKIDKSAGAPAIGLPS